MTRTSPPLHRRAFATLFAGIVATACDAEEELDEEDLGEELDEELDPDEEFRVQFAGWSGQFALVQDDSVASKATGSVEIVMREGGLPIFYEDYYVRGTCGVTFISPHFAVTAAHCVDSTNVPNPAIHTVPVTTYDISPISVFALWVASFVEGDFPNYVPLADASEFVGYDTQTYDCTVSARCAYGSHNCSFAGDVAMLYCPARASAASWIPVAPSDPESGPVEMYWFHELLTMPTNTPAGTAPATDWDRFHHYTELTITNGVYDHEQNYHYLSGART